MEDERVEAVCDIRYGFGNPCRYLQEVLNGFLRCLGLERSGGGGGGGGVGGGGDSSKEGESGGGDGGSAGGEGGGDGGVEMDDPSTMDPIDEPASATTQGLTGRRAPPRGPISSGGPGQTN